MEECKRLPHVVDVRTRGAIGVVELDHEPDASRLCAEFVQLGAWLRPMGRVVYLTPPFIIADEELAKLMTAIQTVLRRCR